MPLHSKSAEIPLPTYIKGISALFTVMFKYKTCVMCIMTTKSKKEYKWKTVKAFLKDLQKAKEDPSFMKALRAFIRYHSQ